MKLTEQVVEEFASSLLECDGKSVEAYGVKGEKSTTWRKTFKSYDALQKWVDGADGVEVHGVRVLADEENPANEE